MYLNGRGYNTMHAEVGIIIFILQKDNGGIVMATFVPEFINCTDPDSATLKDVAGE